MPEESNLDAGLWLLVGIVAIFFLILLIFGLVTFINDFSSELRYLNNEIGRTTGEERRHWIRQRRRLWLSLIPFVRYWTTYNRVYLCGERDNLMILGLVLFIFTSRYHGPTHPRGWAAIKEYNRIHCCAFWLPKGNEGEWKVWIIRWKKYGISYPRHLWCWWYFAPCSLWGHGY